MQRKFKKIKVHIVLISYLFREHNIDTSSTVAQHRSHVCTLNLFYMSCTCHVHTHACIHIYT